MKNSLGKFYGVGVGPGDPKLLTVKALEVLKTAQVIAFPKSRLDRESIALEIVKDYLSPEVRFLELEMPMTSEESVLQKSWEAGAKAITKEIQKGYAVAFVTLGDASLYSTYSYLLQYLKQEISEDQIETVPGITALSAAAARLNIPLALGDEPLIVLPSSENAEKYLAFPNIVMLKVSRRLPETLEVLGEKGKSSVLATRIGQAEEEINWFPQTEDFEGKKVDYMSLLLVKEGLEKWVK